MNISENPDFEAFLERHSRALGGYARLLTGNRHDAEDLLADTLIDALHRWPRIAAMDHPLAYVRTMITTRHIGRQRRWFRRTEVFVDSDGLSLIEVSPVEVRDEYVDVTDRAEIETLLRALPARQRAALVLHFYCDLPYADVGRELGLTAAGARTLVFRALAVLRPAQPLKDVR